MSNFKKYLIQAINEQILPEDTGNCTWKLRMCNPPGDPPFACWQYWCDDEQVSSGPPNGQPPKCCMPRNAPSCDCDWSINPKEIKKDTRTNSFPKGGRNLPPMDSSMFGG